MTNYLYLELRPVLSRRHQDQVCAARKHQIETKGQLQSVVYHIRSSEYDSFYDVIGVLDDTIGV